MPPGIARIRSSMGRASYWTVDKRSGALARSRNRLLNRFSPGDRHWTGARPRARRRPEARVEQRTIRPRIADVAREAGVSKTAVSFAFNSPDRLSTETASRIRVSPSSSGYTPPPGRPDAHPARDADHRRADAAGALASSSPTRSSARSPRESRSRPRNRATRSISSRRCAGRSPGVEPGDGRRRGRDRPE